MNNYDNNQDNNNGGIHSKFQERLRNIRLSRIRKKRENQAFVLERVSEIRRIVRGNGNILAKKATVISNANNKVLEQDTLVADVIVDIKSTANEREYVKKKVGSVEEIVLSDNNNDEFIVDDSKGSLKKTEDLESKVIFIRQNKPQKISNNRVFVEDLDKISDNKKRELLRQKGIDIINKIKDSYEDKLDELEVLSSELFLLSQKQNSELELKKVEEIKKEINEIIDRINGIIKQYNLYKKNYYLEDIIDIDDNIIIEDIINYRDLLNSLDGEKKFVKEYKSLEEFKSLYNNLVGIKEETERIKLDNEEKIIEYQIRDKKYDDVKLGLVSVLDIDKKCTLEINKQNQYFDQIMGKISVIEKEEYVTRHMKGIGNLVGNSLKYMGLLLLSPFAGIVPGIAMQTIATKRMIGNAYNHLHIEEEKHIKYYAIDYDRELNFHLTDIRYTVDLIDDTLQDVKRLKEDFMLIYNSSIPGYEDTLKKLSQIENKLLHNQNRVNIIKKRLNNSKKINDDKLKKVRELNKNS